MNIQAILAIITLATQLLVSAQGTNIPLEQKQMAIDIANNAITLANQYISSSQVAPNTGGIVVGAPIPLISPALPTPAYRLQIISNSLTKDGGSVGFRVINPQGRSVKSRNPNFLESYPLYDSMKFKGGRQTFAHTDACNGRFVNSGDYSIDFRGVGDNPDLEIDDGAVTLQVVFCGVLLEATTTLGE